MSCACGGSLVLRLWLVKNKKTKNEGPQNGSDGDFE